MVIITGLGEGSVCPSSILPELIVAFKNGDKLFQLVRR